jgi:hypothetical protein
MTNQRLNPYVGPRSFRTGETLYGRDRELNELLDLLIAEAASARGSCRVS